MQTIWKPDLSAHSGPLYRVIAEALAEDIRSDRLPAGTRLPTMRDLAEQLRVTVGTVYRSYAVAETQGLIVRQRGRGTFVCEAPAAATADGPPTDTGGAIDFSRNEPVEIRLSGTLQRTLAAMAREQNLEGMLDYGFSQGQPRHRMVLARWMAERGLAVDARRLIVTSGAQQALTIALGALTRAGDTLMVEELTYPGIKSLARLFGLRLKPIAIDDQGLQPEAVRAACREASTGPSRDARVGSQDTRLLYCMPNLHNPTTATLAPERREALAAIADEEGLVIIEDDVHPQRSARGEGGEWPTIARLAPNATIYISSLSKTVAPGLRVGAIAVPAHLYDHFVAVTQTTSWMAPPLMAELACRWIEDGTASELERERDRITRGLQAVARRGLADLEPGYRAHHNLIWLRLPTAWTGREFAARAAEHGVVVAPAEDFAIDPSRAPSAVRIGLPNTKKRSWAMRSRAWLKSCVAAPGRSSSRCKAPPPHAVCEIRIF